MASKTKQQLSEAVGTRLGIRSAVEALSAEDSQLIEQAYDAWREEAIDKGRAYWPNTNRTTAEIPNAVFNAVVLIIAGRVAADFQRDEPVVTDDDGKQMTATAKGNRDLIRHLAKPASGNPVSSTYY